MSFSAYAGAILLTEPSMPSGLKRSWVPGPADPRGAEGVVHVWRVRLTAVADDLVELLCDEERARAERLAGARERQLWARSRGVLRALLSRYSQRDPSALRFAAAEHGKPELADGAGLCFNLSHSGGLGLYAFTVGCAVGVDVELAPRRIDEAALAARAFGPAEGRRLAGLDPAARRREFLRLWVRHEAELKCLGGGFAGTPADRTAGERPWIAELALDGEAAGAVAASAPPRELRCWDWQDGFQA
jgi:4'-phosphopantetheinyl transferase